MNTRIPALILVAGAVFTTAALAQTTETPTTPQDQRIQGEVIDRISTDPRLSHGEVGVEIDAGIVTLTGNALDRNQMDWIVEDTQGVDGVKEVNNLLSAQIGYF